MQPTLSYPENSSTATGSEPTLVRQEKRRDAEAQGTAPGKRRGGSKPPPFDPVALPARFRRDARWRVQDMRKHVPPGNARELLLIASDPADLLLVVDCHALELLPFRISPTDVYGPRLTIG